MTAVASVQLATDLAARRRDEAGLDLARVQRGQRFAQDQLEQGPGAQSRVPVAGLAGQRMGATAVLALALLCWAFLAWTIIAMDHPLAQLWGPALTTVAQDFAELGRRGWQLLRDPDAGPRLITLTPDLIVRASTAAPTGRPTRDR